MSDSCKLFEKQPTTVSCQIIPHNYNQEVTCMSSPLCHIHQLECPHPVTWQLLIWNCWHVNADATMYVLIPVYRSRISKH